MSNCNTLPDTTKLLTVEQIAARYSFAASTVYAWIKRASDPLPAIKLGNSWRIAEVDLKAWIKRQTPTSAPGQRVPTATVGLPSAAEVEAARRTLEELGV